MSSTLDDLLAQHAQQRQALEALRASIVALGEAAPPELVAQEGALVAALAATEAALWAGGVTQITTAAGMSPGATSTGVRGTSSAAGNFTAM